MGSRNTAPPITVISFGLNPAPRWQNGVAIATVSFVPAAIGIAGPGAGSICGYRFTDLHDVEIRPQGASPFAMYECHARTGPTQAELTPYAWSRVSGLRLGRQQQKYRMVLYLRCDHPWSLVTGRLLLTPNIMPDGEPPAPRWMELVGEYSNVSRSPTPSSSSSRSSSGRSRSRSAVPPMPENSPSPPHSKERKRQRGDETELDGPKSNRRKVESPSASATSKGNKPITASIDPSFDRTILNPWREPYPKTLIPLGASGHDLLVWTNGATSWDGCWQFQIVKHGETDPVIPAYQKIDVAYFVEALGGWESCGTCFTGGHVAKPNEKVKVKFRDGLEVKFRLPGVQEDDVIQVPRPPAMPVSA
uniref:Uncharacterized protein n=1 Tax=Mycena chlorophos TaxID=658473 RepID=A0ABQ0L6U8_MYCCL|nr:predicted protein [Mycena chlorophos]